MAAVTCRQDTVSHDSLILPDISSWHPKRLKMQERNKCHSDWRKSAGMEKAQKRRSIAHVLYSSLLKVSSACIQLPKDNTKKHLKTNAQTSYKV